MKFIYMNDEQKQVRVRIQDSRYDHILCTGDIWTSLAPGEARVFEVIVPEGSHLYVKKWPDVVLLSVVLSDVVVQLEVSPPRVVVV
jgi:hypothetical protein